MSSFQKLAGVQIPTFALLVLLVCLTAPAQAANVAANGSVLDNSVPPIGSEGYYFAYLDQVGGGTPSGIDNGNGADQTVLPSYISNLAINATQRYTSGDDNGAYSDIVLNGINYNTGLAFNFIAPNTSQLVATITVGTAGSFQLGILGDNPDAGGHSGLWTVASSNSASANAGANATNNFYLFNITNAAVNDVITITASTGPNFNGAEIGGLTFDNFVPTPEPASLVLFGLGAVGLVVAARRRKV